VVLLVSSNDGRHLLEFTTGELELLAGCVRETLEAIEEWEFETRVGATREATRTLGRELRRVYRGTDGTSSA
jgi:hypothetical protein